MAEGVSLWEACSLDVISVGIRDPGAPQGVWKGVLVKLAFTHLHHPPLTASIYSCALQMKVCETISHQEKISTPPHDPFFLNLLDTTASEKLGLKKGSD